MRRGNCLVKDLVDRQKAVVPRPADRLCVGKGSSVSDTGMQLPLTPTERMRQRIQRQRVERRVLEILAGKKLDYVTQLSPGVVVVVTRDEAESRGGDQTRLSYIIQMRLTSAPLQRPVAAREWHARTAGKQRPGLDN